MKIAMIAALSIATAATTLPLAAIAHADDHAQFASPSGNIRCATDVLSSGPAVFCQIGHMTYAVPPGLPTDERTGAPCEPGSDAGRDFRLDQGKPGIMRCTYSEVDSGFGAWPTVDYGQTRSIGAITCDSEQSGITCTDSSSGHFFRVSSDSYQLG